MEWLNLINEIFQVCIIPLLGVFTTYLVKYISKKTQELQLKTDSEIADKYISMLSETITSCVIATNQTYVETLKKEGKFDLEAQKIAFDKTKTTIMSVLSKDVIKYLSSITEDVDLYITQQIEATVNNNKMLTVGIQ